MYEGNSTNPLMGDIVPIAIYGEEISDKAPIHFWKKVNGKEMFATLSPAAGDILAYAEGQMKPLLV